MVFLIEPGGYLQWAEPDVESFRIEKTNPETKVDALCEVLTLSQRQDVRLSPTWVPRLVALFIEIGLRNVQSNIRDTSPILLLSAIW